VAYSNFVASVDGVTSLGSTPSAGSEISGRNPADRFLMGLLRACAEAVVVGAGTLRATPGHHWTAEHVYPEVAEAFASLRSTLGRTPKPRLVVLSASGDVPASHPAVVDGATIVTTAAGAARLRPRLPGTCDLIELENGGGVDLPAAFAELRRRGCEVILTEGGPHVMGEMIGRRLLDEMFITLSPVIAGRDDNTRLGMVAGAEFLPGRGVWASLRSARRHDDFLFLRYAIRSG
jgi:riboflavin biosynthesis pyrimidine reductase